MPHEAINTILAIDDTPDKLELMALLLRQTGYQVSTAGYAREGLKMARLQPPDLIISDVSMHGMDGIELCRRVRADDKLHNVPIMLVTALRQNTDSVLAGLQAGAYDYLEAQNPRTKPFLSFSEEDFYSVSARVPFKSHAPLIRVTHIFKVHENCQVRRKPASTALVNQRGAGGTSKAAESPA